MSYSFMYEQTDVPEGQTLCEWRGRNAPLLNRRRWWLSMFAGWRA